MKYYKVTAKCGHVSNGFYIDKDFPVKAFSGSEAAQKVKYFPRVKKHLKNKITACEEISYREYRTIQKESKDGYLTARNKRDQVNNCITIEEEKKALEFTEKPTHKIDYNYHELKEKQIVKIAKDIIKYELDIPVLNYNI